MSLKKLVIGLAVVAMVFTVTGVAKADTLSDLQTQIATLMAQIATLQGGAGTGSAAAGTAVQYNSDLTVGSTGADVTALQQFLVSKGMLQMPANVSYGYFGPATKAAVKTYQASVGISSTGYVGPLTRANLNTLTAVANPGTGTGTGTVALCPNGMTLASNCATAPGTGTGTGILTGGAGDITVTLKNSGTVDQVLEGNNDAKVLGMDIKAQGSDVSVGSVKVEITVPTTVSGHLNRYVDSVDVMMNGKVVGSADVSDFTKNSNVYSANVAISNAVVKKDAIQRFYVTVNAAGTIDTTNLGKDFTVEATSIRFQDATGALFSDSESNVTNTFTFENLSTGGDVTLTLSEDDASVNNADTITVDSTTETNDVALMSFKLKAKDSDITVDTIPFTLTGTGAGVPEMASDFRLLMDGKEVGTLAQGASTAVASTTLASSTDTTYYIAFQNLDDDDVVINAGDTATFSLVADIRHLGGAFTDGDKLHAALDADNIVAEDPNGDSLDAAALKGAITAEDKTFSLSAATITGYNWVVGGTGSYLDFFFTVNASDDSFNVLSSSIASSTTGVGTGGFATTSNGVLSKSSGTATTNSAGSSYTVAAGNTATFRIEYTISGTNGKTAEVTITSVAGKTVPDDKQLSPKAVLNVNS